MGVRKTTDFIEKLTWGLAAFMVACSVLTAYFVPTTHAESSVIMEQAVKEQTLLRLILHSNFLDSIFLNHKGKRFASFRRQTAFF